MQVLRELVTVIREQEPIDHWETGKMADARIFKPGDLPCRCTETVGFQATSNWLYVLGLRSILRLIFRAALARREWMRFPYPGEGFFLLRFSGARNTAADIFGK